MFGETVTVLTRAQTGTDRYGKPAYDWPGPGVEVTGCAVAPRTSAEPLEVGRQAVITGLTVYMPSWVTVGPYDRLIVRGVTYRVEGEPGQWRTPYTGRRPGIEVAVTRADG